MLSSPARLELLHVLRSPKALHEIHVDPALTRVGENPERPLSRQAVSRHLERLLDAGLIRRDAPREKGRTDTYVLNHERLFAVVSEMRNLSKLRPVVQNERIDQTMAKGAAHEPRLPPTPRLMVAFGRDDGVTFGLAGNVGTRWRIGRSPACEIRLDYDPFLSAENSILESTPQGFLLHDVATNRNGTWVNGRRLPPGAQTPLRGGDLINVGQSALVLQL